MANDEYRLVLSEGEAAKALSLSVSTLRRMRKEGNGPRFLGVSEGRVGYTREALEGWVRFISGLEEMAREVEAKARGPRSS